MNNKPNDDLTVEELHRLGMIARGTPGEEWPPPGTTLAALMELSEAMHGLVDAMVHELKIHKLLDWMESKLRKTKPT